MTIYEIDERIYSLIDEETGEIADIELFNELNFERDEKIENIVLWIKELKATAEAIKNEENELKKRREVTENKAKNLKVFLRQILNGEKFKTAKVNVSYRQTEKVILEDDFINWAISNNKDDLLKYSDPEPILSEIKTAIKEGKEIPFAKIEQNVAIIIK